MRIFTGNSDSFILPRSYVPFELRHFVKMKNTAKADCQRNSFETTPQNFVKLRSYDGHDE